MLEESEREKHLSQPLESKLLQLQAAEKKACD